MFKATEYAERIDYLSDSLRENLIENYSDLTEESIGRVVSRVMGDFQHRLTTNEKIKINFTAIPIESWDFFILNPLVKIAQIECTRTLNEGFQGEQKRADQEDLNRFSQSKEESDKFYYYEKLSSRKDDDSDNDSLHLEDDEPIKRNPS